MLRGGLSLTNVVHSTKDANLCAAKEYILTTSPGTETPWYEENDGIWELGINP